MLYVLIAQSIKNALVKYLGNIYYKTNFKPVCLSLSLNKYFMARIFVIRVLTHIHFLKKLSNWQILDKKMYDENNWKGLD